MRKVSGIVATLRDIDVKGKGVGAANLEVADLYKEMLYSIFK
jgi:DNA polymerase-3 subunit delta